MLTHKALAACLVSTLASSVYAIDTNKKIESYHKEMKSLEKKTSCALKNCNEKAECIDTKYNTFVSKRDKLVKSKLHVKLKYFKRVAKKTLKSEHKGIQSTSFDASSCFDKSDSEIETAISSLL